MTSILTDQHLYDLVTTAIKETIADFKTAHDQGVSFSRTSDSNHSKRFVYRLGKASEGWSKEAYGEAVTTRYLDMSELGKAGEAPGEFLWDVFVGRTQRVPSGRRDVVVEGLLAVESELCDDHQDDFDKLMVAAAADRVFVMDWGGPPERPIGRLARLQAQCEVARVAIWVVTVRPLDTWKGESVNSVILDISRLGPGGVVRSNLAELAQRG